MPGISTSSDVEMIVHTHYLEKRGIKGKWRQEDKYEQLSVGQALLHLQLLSSISSSLIIDIFTIWTRTWRNQSKVIYWVHFYTTPKGNSNLFCKVLHLPSKFHAPHLWPCMPRSINLLDGLGFRCESWEEREK